MKNEVKQLLEQVATCNNMTKINDKWYRGENGTIFKMTNFGFVIGSPIKDADYPIPKLNISRGFGLFYGK